MCIQLPVSHLTYLQHKLLSGLVPNQDQLKYKATLGVVANDKNQVKF